MTSPDEPYDAITALSDALRDAGAVPTMDRRRSTALPCWRCDRKDGPRVLIEIGRYTRAVGGNLRPGDKIVRPLCIACEAETAPTMRLTGPDIDDHGRGGEGVACSVHDQPLDTCPCPKGAGAWLEYRRLWTEARDFAAALAGPPAPGLEKAIATIATRPRAEGRDAAALDVDDAMDLVTTGAIIYRARLAAIAQGLGLTDPGAQDHVLMRIAQLQHHGG